MKARPFHSFLSLHGARGLRPPFPRPFAHFTRYGAMPPRREGAAWGGMAARHGPHTRSSPCHPRPMTSDGPRAAGVAVCPRRSLIPSAPLSLRGPRLPSGWRGGRYTPLHPTLPCSLRVGRCRRPACGHSDTHTPPTLFTPKGVR